MKVFHVTTSSCNPATQDKFWEGAIEHVKYCPSEKQIRNPRFLRFYNKERYKLFNYVEEDIPLMAVEAIARLPFVGSKSTVQQIEKFKKFKKIVNQVNDDITYFKINKWIFDNRELLKILNFMSEEDKKMFVFDPRLINWKEEGAKFVYGLQKFYLLQDVPNYDSGYRGILQMNHFEIGHDIKFALRSKSIISNKDLRTLHNFVINPNKFQKFINLLFPINTFSQGDGQKSIKSGAIIQLNQ